MPLFASNVALATIVCTYVFGFFAIIFVAIHLFVRLHLFGKFSIEDISTCFALIVTMGLIGQITWAVVDEGQGEHMADVTRSQFELTAKSLLANEALWALVNACIRLSASLSLLRIFGCVHAFRYQANTFMLFTAIHGVAALIVAVSICHPIQASWDPQVQGSCGDQTAAYVGLEVGGLLLDTYILALPARYVVRLDMRIKRKFIILFVLSAGAVVMVITGFRIAALHRVNSSDFSYDQGYLGLLSTLGALLGVISCCVLSIRPFIRYLQGTFSRRPTDTENHDTIPLEQQQVGKHRDAFEDHR
ncbi:uncharacterized protein GGS22DRAFT_139484 [Annulohypoxylon maeteangense]|uniref:uncharacterized protein n=1 Tax=Annulohypoxylon maeteangense TaxID=1927788 RepID=UPI00200766D3|nr:uncharacterized protein GGS22DRAFT_139484 [Annulohypoxylon maeteangense]KAI0885142.1 hypothetical protein GGS22DRAFT_139484 [Annulohypoxylon maeteangense]